MLEGDVLAVRRAVAPDEPFAIGLRLSGVALDEAGRPEALAAMKDYLAAHDLYVFTINAFPYGPFHGTRVKEDVYLPDWRDEERLRYSNAAADYLAALLPDDMTGSVSTVPGCFRPHATGADTVAAMADRLLRHVAHLVDLERRTGRRIALAVEPEPACFLETTAEAVDFFEQHLFSAAAARRLATLAGIAAAEAEPALRRHLGLCLDLCHAAIEFETPGEAVNTLRGAGVSVPKMQISAGLRLDSVGPGTRELLAPFDDGVYLHQVVERKDGTLTRYTDLDDAFAALAGAPDDALPEWRVHYHVPLFLADLGAFASTQDFVREALALHRAEPISQHLEVETYTWGVMPQHYRSEGIVPAIARELQWVRQQLA